MVRCQILKETGEGIKAHHEGFVLLGDVLKERACTLFRSCHLDAFHATRSIDQDAYNYGARFAIKKQYFLFFTILVDFKLRHPHVRNVDTSIIRNIYIKRHNVDLGSKHRALKITGENGFLTLPTCRISN